MSCIGNLVAPPPARAVAEVFGAMGVEVAVPGPTVVLHRQFDVGRLPSGLGGECGVSYFSGLSSLGWSRSDPALRRRRQIIEETVNDFSGKCLGR